jgi:hypothetical protein
MTSCPCATNRSHKCDPRKPAPPVTRMRLVFMSVESLPAAMVGRKCLESSAFHGRAFAPGFVRSEAFCTLSSREAMADKLGSRSVAKWRGNLGNLSSASGSPDSCAVYAHGSILFCLSVGFSRRMAHTRFGREEVSGWAAPTRRVALVECVTTKAHGQGAPVPKPPMPPKGCCPRS